MKIGKALIPLVVASAVSSALHLLMAMALFAWLVGGIDGQRVTPEVAVAAAFAFATLGAMATAGIYVLALKVRR